jgi:parallel beta-helix repeat protein
MKRIFLTLLFILAASTVHSANYWVRPDGILGGCLPSVNPPATASGYVSTVNAGLACLAANPIGSTLFVRAGTYSEFISFRSSDGHVMKGATSRATGPVISGYPGDTTPTIRGNGSEALMMFSIESPWITVKDLKFDAEHSKARARGTLVQVSGVGIRLENIEVMRAQTLDNIEGTLGILVNANADQAELVNSRIHDTPGNLSDLAATGDGYGVYWIGTNGLIEGNDIYNSGGYGLHLFNSGSNSVSNNIARKNRFWGNGTRGTQPAQVVMATGSNNRLYNNIIRDPAFTWQGAIDINFRCTDCLVENNTVVGSHAYGILIIDGNGDGTGLPLRTIVKNNIFDGAAVSINEHASAVAGKQVYTNNLCVPGACERGTSNQNPVANGVRFINRAAADYRLCTGLNLPVSGCPGASAAIGTGTNLSSIFTTAIDGAPRTDPWSIGAYAATVASPTIAITSPTTLETYSTNTGLVSLSGSAAPGSGASLSSVVWSNDRGGGGAASGLTSWNKTDIPLVAGGINTITVTASDSNGGVTSATLRVAYSVPALLAAYGFGEGTGTTVADLSGNGRTATFSGAVTWGSGKYGGAAVLNGGHLSIPAFPASVAPVGSVTVSLTAKVSAVFTDFRALLVSNYSFYLYGSSSSPCGPGGVQGGADGLSTTGACHSTVLPVGSNVDLAFTYDGVEQKLYRDGVLVSTEPASGHFTTPTGNIQIGCSTFGECSQVTISEIRIYNGARSAAEIATDRATRLIAAAAVSAPVLRLGPGVHKFQGIQNFGAVAP